MSIFLSFSNSLEQLIIAIIGFILMMSIVVFVHEFGHFYVARLCGIKVTDFSIGFGKKLLSKQDKHGTTWSLSLIPMGGYVKFFGDKSVASEEDLEELKALSESEKKQTFFFKSILQKMAVILAGPVSNIILCLLLLFSINFFIGIVDLKPVIQDIAVDSAASRNGLMAGDIFVTVNERHIKTAQDVRQEVAASFGEPINFKILRQDTELSLSFAPDMIQVNKEKSPVIGVTFKDKPENTIIWQYDFMRSIQQSYQDTFFVARLTAKFFGQLFAGKADIDNLSGPIRIGDAAGTALKTGMWSFLLLMALVSMSVGLVNLLPVPMLDGGHLLFYLFEAFGLKANPYVREIAFKAGFIVVISVMLFTVINDIITIGLR